MQPEERTPVAVRPDRAPCSSPTQLRLERCKSCRGSQLVPWNCGEEKSEAQNTEVAESGLTMTDRRVKLAKMDADVAAMEES